MVSEFFSLLFFFTTISFSSCFILYYIIFLCLPARLSVVSLGSGVASRSVFFFLICKRNLRILSTSYLCKYSWQSINYLEPKRARFFPKIQFILSIFAGISSLCIYNHSQYSEKRLNLCPFCYLLLVFLIFFFRPPSNGIFSHLPMGCFFSSENQTIFLHITTTIVGSNMRQKLLHGDAKCKGRKPPQLCSVSYKLSRNWKSN